MIEKKILIADDDESILWILEDLLKDKGFHVITAGDGTQAMRLIKDKTLTLALIDINMPGKDGLEVLKKSPPELPVIIMTAEGTMDNTLLAMKRGAFDYITKPFDLGELDIIIDRSTENSKLKKELSSLKEKLKEQQQTGNAFIGKSKSMQQLFKAIGKIAGKDVTVLLLGESGTGKELLARLIHSHSKRAAAPFIAVNSAAIPRELMESELFGHEKGAFTGAVSQKKGKFELAHEGTLFLDEIGDMELDLQARMLRAIEEGEFYRVGGTVPVKVDVRILTATNRNLEKAIEEKRFREDLYYRLNVLSLTLPPLRKRAGDIPLLCKHFLNKFSLEMETDTKTLSENAMKELSAYTWPGNIRELQNILRRAVLLSPNIRLTTEDLALPENKDKNKKESIEDIITARLKDFIDKTPSRGAQDLYGSIMPFMERPLIKLVLKKTRLNQVQAAELLGINRNTLRKKIKELKIKMKDIKD
jgi:two-component system nitrogen regulation response regulator GlnG